MITIAKNAQEVDAEVWRKVAHAFQEALGLDDDEVVFDATIIDDLDAESLDLLDIAFRLERAFNIAIPRGGIQKAAQEGADGDGINADGTLSDYALKRLSEAMPEVDPDRFAPGLKPADVANLFIVGTFYNLVVKLINEKEN